MRRRASFGNRCRCSTIGCEVGGVTLCVCVCVCVCCARLCVCARWSDEQRQVKAGSLCSAAVSHATAGQHTASIYWYVLLPSLCGRSRCRIQSYSTCACMDVPSLAHRDHYFISVHVELDPAGQRAGAHPTLLLVFTAHRRSPAAARILF